jgi:hypothetical protein
MRVLADQLVNKAFKVTPARVIQLANAQNCARHDIEANSLLRRELLNSILDRRRSAVSLSGQSRQKPRPRHLSNRR